MTKLDFPSWLQKELDAREWTQADLARDTGLSTGGVAQLMNGRRNPGPEACNVIARAFGYPPDVVFRAAGLLPANTEMTEEDRKMMYLFHRMTPEEQRVLYGLGEVLVNQRQEKSPRGAEG